MIPDDLRKDLHANPPKICSGNVEIIIQSALDDRAEVEIVTPLQLGDVVLDVGCGYGRLAVAFAGTDVFYWGVDVSRSRVANASRLLRNYPSCKFQQLDVVNQRYNLEGSLAEQAFHLEAEDGFFAAAFAISLFTHMPDAEGVSCYLREIHRVLRPGGVLLMSWITSDPDLRESNAHRAVHTVDVVDRLLAETGFKVVKETGVGKVAQPLRLLAVTCLGQPGKESLDEH